MITGCNTITAKATYLVKMTMSEGYFSFRVIDQVIKEPGTQSTPSQCLKS